jgi:hypothetical protein
LTFGRIKNKAVAGHASVSQVSGALTDTEGFEVYTRLISLKNPYKIKLKLVFCSLCNLHGSMEHSFKLREYQYELKKQPRLTKWMDKKSEHNL